MLCCVLCVVKKMCNLMSIFKARMEKGFVNLLSAIKRLESIIGTHNLPYLIENMELKWIWYHLLDFYLDLMAMTKWHMCVKSRICLPGPFRIDPFMLPFRNDSSLHIHFQPILHQLFNVYSDCVDVEGAHYNQRHSEQANEPGHGYHKMSIITIQSIRDKNNHNNRWPLIGNRNSAEWNCDWRHRTEFSRIDRQTFAHTHTHTHIA